MPLPAGILKLSGDGHEGQTMATVAAVASSPEAIVTLHGVSWRTYESLLADFVDRSVPHFAYDRGCWKS